MRFTADQYDSAIAALREASSQLEPNGDCCHVCGDSGHFAGECGHNPLVAVEICRSIARESEALHETLHYLAGWESRFGETLGPAKVVAPPGPRCDFCNRPVREGHVCDREQCRRHERELRESLDAAHRQEVREAVWNLLIQWGWHANDTVSPWWLWRWLYTLKALACFLLPLRWRMQESSYDTIDGLAIWGEHYVHFSGGSGEGWNSVRVGRGVFRQWFAWVEHETSV